MEHAARTRFALRLMAGLAMAGATVPAHSQWLTPSSASFSKSEAILGGSPSRLALILSSQSSGAPVTAAAFAAAVPAVYSRPAPFALDREQAPDLTASPDRPDIFNTVALPIDRSPLDYRWKRVGASGVGGRAATFAIALRDQGKRARIEAVNAYVNARVTFVDDSRQYGVADSWSAASDTLARGRGDCEDYALAKMALLRRAGFADKDLYFVVLKDLTRRADHAVLVVRAADHMYVLDNGTERLLDSEAIRDYRPVLTFASTGTWTHGYRVNKAPMAIASADDDQIKYVAPSADNQRSWSASLLAFNTGFNK